MNQSIERSGRRTRMRSILIFAGVVGGWVLFDLASLAAGFEPYLVVRMLPGSLAAVLVGALIGLVCSLSRWIPWSIAALAAAMFVMERLGGSKEDTTVRLLSLAAFLITLGAGATHLLVRFGARSLPAAFALGAMIAVALFHHRVGSTAVSWTVLATGGAVVVGQWLPGRPLRRTVAVASPLACVAFVVLTGRDRSALRRVDRPHEIQPTGELPNLLLISLDTLRADHLSIYGASRMTTPELDEYLRASCDVYLQARSTSSWTLPSHASLFTGLYPAEHGATHARTGESGMFIPATYNAARLRDDTTTLAEHLASQGYRTGAIVSNYGFLSSAYGLDRGFEHYDDRPGANVWAGRSRCALIQFAGFQLGLGVRTYRDAETITDQALEWLDGQPPARPYFLFVNYMDVHLPNIPRPSDRSAFGDDLEPGVRATVEAQTALAYDRELLYLDRQVARLLRAVEETERMENTVLVITSDHGEAMGEKGFWRHSATMYEQVIKVPLFIQPVERRPRLIEEPINGAEVFHQILYELGIEENPSQDRRGWIGEWYQSQQINSARTMDLSRDLVAWIAEGHKYIVSSQGDVEIYDILDDPDERVDLAAEPDFEERAREAVRVAREWWAEHPPRPTLVPELGDDQLEHLRRLGYIH